MYILRTIKVKYFHILEEIFWVEDHVNDMIFFM